MLSTTNIEVDILPIVVGFATEVFLVVVRVFVAEIVTAGTSKARHGVGLDGIALLRDPVRGAGQRRLTRLGGFVLADGRQLERKFRFFHGVRHAVLVIDRERLTPITLTAEDGITETVVGLARADTQFLQFLNHALNGFLDRQAVKEARIDEFTVLGIKALLPSGRVSRLRARFFHHLNDRQVEMTSEGEVAAIVCRHGHNGTCAVTHQYVVGNPDGQFGTSNGVDAVCTREGATHFAYLSHTLALTAILGAGDVFLHLSTLLRRGDFRNQLMFRSQHHESSAKQSIRTGSEHLKVDVLTVHLENDRSTHGLTYPVALQVFHRLAPVHGL